MRLDWPSGRNVGGKDVPFCGRLCRLGVSSRELLQEKGLKERNIRKRRETVRPRPLNQSWGLYEEREYSVNPQGVAGLGGSVYYWRSIASAVRSESAIMARAGLAAVALGKVE